jgi:hypothetical protein
MLLHLQVAPWLDYTKKAKTSGALDVVISTGLAMLLGVSPHSPNTAAVAADWTMF